MSLYSQSDIKLLGDNINEINDRIERKQLELYEPSKDERVKVTDLILDFIKRNKRKVYGGFALNKLVINKNKDDAIYKDFQTPDVDFYSPQPIEDLIQLCNELSDSGLKRVMGREGKHKDTYNIFVNFQLYCDISYVPKNIYNRMPFVEIDKINYIHPYFMVIDYLRMITDPLASYWRIEKSLKRMILLQKHYPLPNVDKPIQVIDSTPDLDRASGFINKYLINRKSIINIGFYAYNYFVTKSETKNKNIKPLPVPFYEFISTDYKKDFDDLIEILTKEMPGSKIEHKEYFPFFQFTGYSVEILLDGDVVAVIYSHNGKCLPFQSIDGYETNGKVIIGTFSLTLLYLQIMTMKYRTIEDKAMTTVYMTLISHLIKIKQEYLKNNNKSIFDKTPFQDFIVDCIGTGIHPDREILLRYEERRGKGKKSFFQYDPSKDNRSPDISYVFGNYSGNEIKNTKNLKLMDEPLSIDQIVEDVTQPEPSSETDIAQTDIIQPDIIQPDIAQSDIIQLDSERT
jgi:hypothetical protein